MRSFYFGSTGDGHFLYTPTGERLRRADAIATLPPEFAGGFGPGKAPSARGVGPDQTLCPEKRAGQPQGVARLHHALAPDGTPWTAIAFWDRTGDSRPGSNSAFLFEGTLTFEAACAAAFEHFPAVWRRMTARTPVTLAPAPQLQAANPART